MRLEEFRKTRGDLIDRIAFALDELAKFEDIEDVVIESQIHHSKQEPHIKVSKIDYLGKSFVRLYTYAKDGLGYRAQVILKNSCNAWERLQEYVKEINERRKNYSHGFS